MVNSPVYPPFLRLRAQRGAPRGRGAALGGRAARPGALAAAFVEGTRGSGRAAYLLSSPHNPTGAVHTVDELMSSASWPRPWRAGGGRRDPRALVYAPTRFTPYLSLPVGASAFSLMSASKGFNLAGLNAALALAGAEAAAELARMPEEAAIRGESPRRPRPGRGARARRRCVAGGAAPPASTATVACSRSCSRSTCPRSATACRRRRTWPGSTAAPWAWAPDPAAAFRERGRVALSPGPGFGTGGEGHARLNFATSPAVLAEAVERMASATGWTSRRGSPGSC